MPKLYTKDTWTDEVLADDALHKITDPAGDPIPGSVIDLTTAIAALNSLLEILETGSKISLITDVSVAGTSLTAARMNNIEDGIDSLDDLLVALQNKFTFDAATELTIVTGAVTATQTVHKLQPETGTTDDLDTISGLSEGDILILYVSDAGTDTITIKHGTGNISCIGASDVALSQGSAIFYSDGTTVYLIGGGGGASPLTTKGDLYTYSTKDARLAIGTNGQRIEADSGETTGLKWVDNNGWAKVYGSWTRASATTITVPSGAAGIYSVGDKIKLTQTTVKYFYVVGVADTVLTVAGGSDFTVADAAITDIYVSNAVSPVGFPQWFNLTVPSWTTSGTAFTNQPTSEMAKFCVVGRKMTVKGRALCNATSGGTGLFYATFTSSQHPAFEQYKEGIARNITTFVIGLSFTMADTNVIAMCASAAQTLATNSQYFEYEFNCEI